MAQLQEPRAMGANTRGCMVPCRQDETKMEWNMDSVEPLADAIPVLFILSFNVSLFIIFLVA